MKKNLDFFLLGKGMTIRPNIGRENSQDERDGMIMDSTEGGSSWGVVKITWWWERIDWSLGCTEGVSTT
jgi:hypothetical protein